MSQERWRRVEALFAEATALDPPAREELLSRHRRRDAELVREVEGLLAADGEMGDFLEWPQASPGSAELPHRRLGPYRLVRELGRGGMGAVYLAQRDDDEYEKQVCVKVIRPGLDGEQVLHRFRQERQILAQLGHESIAQLLDGGTTADGHPYLVMEYVDGLPIDSYCDQNRLTVDERLALFRQVCEAIAFAHRRLVVHRDLKPSNILVTSGGTPKLLDFGIAKLLRADASEADGDSDATLTGALGTPRYASPEQLRGEPVTTASDVYSLGVLLYELLCGEQPYELRGSAADELRVTAAQAPSERIVPRRGWRPSTDDEARERSEEIASVRGTSAIRLASRLRGDLDTIVLQAMRFEPSARYPTVDALVGDLERHTGGLPILAAPARLSYRAVKFIGRHRVALAAGGAIAASLLLGSATALWMALEARRSAAAAEQAQHHAQEARLQAESSRSLSESARREAERARDREEDARRQAESARQEAEQALASAEKARREAEHSQRQALAEADKVKLVNRFLGDMLAAADPRSVGSAGDATLREVVDRAAAEIPKHFAHLPEVAAELHDRVGLSYLGMGLLVEAHDHLVIALDLRRELYGEEHLEYAKSLVHVYHHQLVEAIKVADPFTRQDLEEAEARLRQAVQIRERQLGPRHAATTEALAYVASIQRLLGDPLAEDTVIRVLNFFYGPDWSLEQVVADVERRAAQVRLYWLEGNEEAALAAVEKTVRPALENPVFADRVWDGVCSFAENRARQGDVAAEPLYRASIHYGLEQLGPDHPYVARCHCLLGNLLRSEGRMAEAETHYRQAAAIYTRSLGGGQGRSLAAANDLAVTLLDLGRQDEAAGVLEAALAAARSGGLGEDRHVGLLRANAGRLAALRGDRERARLELDASRDILLARLGPLNAATLVVEGYRRNLDEVADSRPGRTWPPLVSETALRGFSGAIIPP